MAEINLGNDNELNINLSPVETLTTTVPDINYIPGYKEAEEERRANEVVRQENEADRIALYNDMVDKVDSGYFDGFSPIVTTSKTDGTTTIEIEDKNGVKTATILDGTDGKDGTKIWYSIMTTKPSLPSSSASVKMVATTDDDFTLTEGNIIVIRLAFTGSAYSSTGYTLNVNNTGDIDIYWGDTRNLTGIGGDTGFYKAGQVLSFLYDGTYYRSIDNRYATTSVFGYTKLSNTISNSNYYAATPSAVKQAYDLADSKQDALVSGTNIKTINNTSLLDSGNLSLEETSNKTTTITSSSTDTQYPSAKAVYDVVGDIASALDTINGESI